MSDTYYRVTQAFGTPVQVNSLADLLDDPPAAVAPITYRFEEYQVVKRTRCGVWLSDRWNDVRRFVLNGTTGKRFAYPDKAAAIYSFYRRKSMEVARLEHRLKTAREQLRLCELDREPV
jgi:hypothetical protein